MAVRPIIKIGKPILRVVCKPVKEITAHTAKLLDDLADTLYATPNSVGLAAPQIGVAERIIIMDCGKGLIELINPVLLEARGEKNDYESCLSLPGVIGKVKRAKYVKVKALNRLGDEILIEGKGLLAKCLQHELDHMEGSLFIDHVSQGQLYDQFTNAKLDVSEMINLSKQNKKK